MVGDDQGSVAMHRHVHQAAVDDRHLHQGAELFDHLMKLQLDFSHSFNLLSTLPFTNRHLLKLETQNRTGTRDHLTKYPLLTIASSMCPWTLSEVCVFITTEVNSGLASACRLLTSLLVRSPN